MPVTRTKTRVLDGKEGMVVMVGCGRTGVRR